LAAFPPSKRGGNRFVAAETPFSRDMAPDRPLARRATLVNCPATSASGIRIESLNLSPLPLDPRGQRSGAASSAEEAPPATQAAPEPAAAEDRISGAMRRLDAALEALDRAIGLHTERRLDMADQEAEYSALQEDRSRLAQALDAAHARIEALQDNQVEAARRVERASAAVRAILAASSEEA
jgi:hypothetical protein